MKRNSNMADDILAEVKTIKRLAERNALEILQEEFEPAVHDLIARQLQESEYEEDMEDDMDYEDEMDAPAPDAISTDADVDIETDTASPDADFDDDMDMSDDSEFNDEEFDLGSIDFDSIIADLEGEVAVDSEMDTDMDTGMDTDMDDDYVDNGMDSEMEDGEYDDEDDLEEGQEDYMDDGKDGLPVGSIEEAIESLYDEMVGSNKPKNRRSNPKKVRNMSESKTVRKNKGQRMQNSKIVAENKRLKQENKKLKEATLSQKKTIRDVNLLNSKLMYSVKISNMFPELTSEEKVSLLTTIDKADTVKEVELVSETIIGRQRSKKKSNRNSKTDISESKQKSKAKARVRRNEITESATRGDKNTFDPRWMELANIKQ